MFTSAKHKQLSKLFLYAQQYHCLDCMYFSAFKNTSVCIAYCKNKSKQTNLWIQANKYICSSSGVLGHQWEDNVLYLFFVHYFFPSIKICSKAIEQTQKRTFAQIRWCPWSQKKAKRTNWKVNIKLSSAERQSNYTKLIRKGMSI